MMSLFKKYYDIIMSICQEKTRIDDVKFCIDGEGEESGVQKELTRTKLA